MSELGAPHGAAGDSPALKNGAKQIYFAKNSNVFLMSDNSRCNFN